MGLSLQYNLRHIRARPVTTLLSVSGVALVLFVYAATLMLAEGLRHTLAATGVRQNIIITRSGAENEVQSSLTREQVALLGADDLIARDTESQQPVATADCMVLLSLRKRSTDQPSNVSVRGTSDRGTRLRPQVEIIAGRAPIPRTQEVMVGAAIAKRFAGTETGSLLRLGGTDWTVVGIFSAPGTAFDSEIWGDAEIMMGVFRRPNFSSMTARLTDSSDAAIAALQARVDSDPRLSVQIKRETQFFADQAKQLALFIEILGTFVTAIYSIAAIIGSMITMFSAVSSRTREIGILRALGFSTSAIVRAFFQESLILSLVGGSIGLGFAGLLTSVTLSTTNFRTFSDLSFGFRLSPRIVLISLGASVGMGLLGALLPAIRAARISVVQAIRG
jgi:putative ABC transport system permease protein